MPGTPAARRPAAKKTPATPAKKPAAAKKAPAKPRARRRTAPTKAAAPAPAVAPLASALVETPGKALERLLGTIVLTPSIAVTAANARQIAAGIPYADPADRPKMTRELSRLQAELINAGVPSGEPPDWTQTTAGVES